MKKLAFVAVALFAVTSLTGCLMPMGGAIQASLMMDVQGAYLVGDDTVKCEKMGSAVSEGYVLFSSGDSSIKAAMEAGGITKIHHVDYKVVNYFGFYAKWETIVWGE